MLRVGGLALALLLAGCNPDLNAPLQEAEFPSVIIATFAIEGETFRFWSTNQNTIAELFALLEGETANRIPRGPLLKGPGDEEHNLPWSWHLHPSLTVLVEEAPMTCSESPSFVEANLESWIEQGEYCPRGATLLKLELSKPGGGTPTL